MEHMGNKEWFGVSNETLNPGITLIRAKKASAE